jgi:hypothetical protein
MEVLAIIVVVLLVLRVHVRLDAGELLKDARRGETNCRPLTWRCGVVAVVVVGHCVGEYGRPLYGVIGWEVSAPS